jgi:hypothetical protein
MNGTARDAVRSPEPRRGFRGRSALVSVCAALVGAAHVATAQGNAGSENAVVPAHGAVALGGASSGSSGATVSATLGQLAGPAASSASYVLHAGVAWTPPEIAGDRPILFGARNASGGKDGGQEVEAFGYNLLAAAPASLQLWFGTQPGTSTTVVSNTRVKSIAPGAVDAVGNPPPEVLLRVTNAHGQDTAKGFAFHPSYLYEPALIQSEHARVGRAVHLHLHTDPNAAIVLVLGQTIPGTAIAIPPLDGAVEVLINQQYAIPFLPLSGDQHRHVVDVPDDPALLGTKLSYQAAALTDLVSLAGAFTNTLTLHVLP